MQLSSTKDNLDAVKQFFETYDDLIEPKDRKQLEQACKLFEKLMKSVQKRQSASEDAYQKFLQNGGQDAVA